MTNLEKYEEQIKPYAYANASWSIYNNEVKLCNQSNCDRCIFNSVLRCSDERNKWLHEEYKESTVDWSKVAVDTPVIVSSDRAVWFNRYFAKYEDDKVYVFCDGATSWSNGDDVIHWKFAKLAEVDND